MEPVLTISGRVTDAQSGQPIDRFTLVPGVIRGERRLPSLHRTMAVAYTGGFYSRPFVESHDPKHRERSPMTRIVRIEAEGYLPAVSRPINADEGHLTMDLPLTRAAGISGTDISADGKPLAGADVLIASSRMRGSFCTSRGRRADYKGKYILLDFWATWCGPCIAETPHFKTVDEAFGKDERFVMIALSEKVTHLFCSV